jgi:hypothetical protein
MQVLGLGYCDYGYNADNLRVSAAGYISWYGPIAQASVTRVRDHGVTVMLCKCRPGREAQWVKIFPWPALSKAYFVLYLVTFSARKPQLHAEPH